jgi:hypothetical protein
MQSTLLNYDWFRVYNNTSVDPAVKTLNTADNYAMDQSNPRRFIKKTELRYGFSAS